MGSLPPEPAGAPGVGCPRTGDPAAGLAVLAAEIAVCRACPRLVAWREAAARERRAAFRGQVYWARPVPGFGDVRARIYVLGLAPAAHGGNRTARVFTGDRSGDWLYRALFRAGLASQPEATGWGDGLRLSGAYVAAAVRCAPPANRPTPEERERCRPFLERELALLSELRVVVALGAFAFDVAARSFGLRPRPRFAHGAEVPLPPADGTAPLPRDGGWLLGSYHPSQRNTFTGVLTEAAFDEVFTRARALAGLESGPRPGPAEVIRTQAGGVVSD